MNKKKSPDETGNEKYSYISRSFSYEGRRYFVKGKTESECTEKKHEKLAELRRGASAVSSSMTVSAWAESWLQTYIKPKVRKAGADKLRGTMSQKNFRMYENMLRNYVLPAVGGMKMREVKDIHLIRILNSRSDMSFSHVSKLRIVLKSMFSQALASRIINFDPSLKLSLPAAEKGRRRSLTPYEREIFEAVASECPYGLWMRFLLGTGIRPNESAALKVAMMNLKDAENATVSITSAVESGSRVIGMPKTEASVRVVPIPADLVPELREAVAGKSPFSFVFTQADGESMLSETSIRRRWESFSRRMDLAMGAETTLRGHIYDPSDLDENGKPLYPDKDGNPRNGHKLAPDLVLYCLRHTYCTDLKRAGVPLKIAQYLMGHADIATTANIYTHSDEEDVKDAAFLINSHRGKSASVENTVENIK